MTPLVLGLTGQRLTNDERALFRAADPAGYILFARNIGAPAAVRALTEELRALSGRDRLPIFIDQEGGRVVRLGPPHWPAVPAAAVFGEAFGRAPVTAIEAARLNARAIAAMLVDLGISIACLPVLDLPAPDAHDVIGDRAYGSDATTVAALGDATLRGLREGGVVGVVKHIPGHGRVTADSHSQLPVVAAGRDELDRDFEPFRRLASAPMAMTAHVVYTALDPHACASRSPVVVDVMRRDIGFAGLLLSDDIGMHALTGTMERRAADVLSAGCDVALYCGGDFDSNARLCETAPAMTQAARQRLDLAMAWPAVPADSDVASLATARDRLLAAA